MKFFSLLLFCLFSANSFASDIVIVGGKAYELKPTDQPTCGETGSSDNVAAKTILRFSLANGKSTAAALCAAGQADKCEKDAQSKFAIDLLFEATRKYPSRYSSDGCKELRNECLTLCNSESSVSKDDCLIGCNQYDSWNK